MRKSDLTLDRVSHRPAARLRRGACLLATLVAATGLVACGGGSAGPSGPRSGPVPVTVAEVQQKTVPFEVTEIGSVAALSTVGIKAQVGGNLVKVSFKKGDLVRKGQVLMVIDQRPYEHALRQAQAKLAADRAQLEQARSDVARYAKLIKDDYITQEQYDQAKTSVASLEAGVQGDEAAVDNAALQLSYCTIKAPITGRAGDLLLDEGNLVKANSDTPLVVINQINPIDVGFSVPEHFLGEVRQRQAEGNLPVVARLRQNHVEPVKGSLSFIDNAVDSSTGTVMLKATFANADGVLWPGQLVDVVLTLGTQQNAVVVPSEAVQSSQSGHIVFVVKADDTVEARTVEIDRTFADETVIAKGVSVGERVVTDGQLRLVPGATVEIKQGQAAS